MDSPSAHAVASRFRLADELGFNIAEHPSLAAALAAADVLLQAGMKRIDILRWDDNPGHFVLVEHRIHSEGERSPAT